MASSTRAPSHSSEDIESDASTPRSSPSPELEKPTVSSSNVATTKKSVVKNQSDTIPDQTPTRFLERCSKLDLEPNPFEQSFSHITSESNDSSSPKPSLPPVTAIASPSSGIPANQQFGWNYPSLRSGPLSPSMLERPIVFDDIPPGRTGTTPMGYYPEPSPRTAALFSSASLSATAFNPANPPANPPLIMTSTIPGAQSSTQSVTAQAQASASAAPSGGMIALSGGVVPAVHGGQQDTVIPKTESDSSTVVNDLSTNKKQNNSKQSNGSTVNRSRRGMSVTSVNSVNSITSDESTGDEDFNELQNDKSQRSVNRSTRRKADDNPSDQPSAKKANSKNKSDLTDEEKRRNFLERNRQAALKCRQRKKQWLANLQAKVEYLTNDNEQLQNQATSLREEILNLKTLLLAHKDCPIAQANGVVLDALQPSAGMGGPMPGMSVGPNGVPMGINVGMLQGPGPGASMQGSVPASAMQQPIPMPQVQMPHMANVNGAPPGSGVIRY